ncbi:MAG: 6-phosphogluconolactonase [Chroococcopsis gigantea SAG 12.99]|jgi:6-phosphogluconolactonase|nr:6-phosphogluconolactonase [Chlorogloea purpurea SAG 13.99]MDV2999961.1 6-phosphogluconolactonase [Chroococcopsis gigantea SAG 12.99]
MTKQVQVLEDKTALINKASDLVTDLMQTAIARRGRCTIALSGGSTPKPLYSALSDQAIPWDKVYVFWGDERYVPSNHPDSNQLLARTAWLDRIPIPALNIYPMPTDSDPENDARSYDATLAQFFGVQLPQFPVFDVILLGMGDDGHTASLFPHTPALTVNDRYITLGDKDGQPRITFTVPLINAARSVVFLVSGESKRPALEQIFASLGDEKQYPSRLIQPSGDLIWLLDKAAGDHLKL